MPVEARHGMKKGTEHDIVQTDTKGVWDKQTAVDWMVKAASGNTVHIDRELAEELVEELRSLMYHWHPNPDGADNRCELCCEEPGVDSGWTIKHKTSCIGQRAVDEFEAALSR